MLSHKHTYQGQSAVTVLKAILGQVSGAIYLYEVGASATQTFLRKQNPSGDTAWAKNYSPIETTYRGVVVSPDEASLFMIGNIAGQVDIYKINAATGDFVSKYTR